MPGGGSQPKLPNLNEKIFITDIIFFFFCLNTLADSLFFSCNIVLFESDTCIQSEKISLRGPDFHVALVVTYC